MYLRAIKFDLKKTWASLETGIPSKIQNQKTNSMLKYYNLKLHSSVWLKMLKTLKNVKDNFDK